VAWFFFVLLKCELPASPWSQRQAFESWRETETEGETGRVRESRDREIGRERGRSSGRSREPKKTSRTRENLRARGRSDRLEVRFSGGSTTAEPEYVKQRGRSERDPWDPKTDWRPNPLWIAGGWCCVDAGGLRRDSQWVLEADFQRFNLWPIVAHLPGTSMWLNENPLGKWFL